MNKIYFKYFLLVVTCLCFTLFVSSCKKDSNSGGTTPDTVKPLATLGLYEVDSGAYRRIFIPITQVGNQKVTYYGAFDTGSSGLTLDAHGILPDAMITANGITIAGDSVVVNGITVTSKTSTISYGNKTSEISEYGNLAYAPVTIGNSDGTITTKRIPIFLYYKIYDVTNKVTEAAHSNDVFGVGPGVSAASGSIGSPLSYFTTGTNVTSGFKLALLNRGAFSLNGTYVSGLLTIGLVPADLASGNFVMHGLTNLGQNGYSPNIPATVTYNGKSISATVLFDTGDPAQAIIEDNTTGATIGDLPMGASVTIATTSGFNYTYVTGQDDNLTTISKTSITGDPRTIFSINFFLSNEYVLDYANHRIGLKNN